MKKNARPKIQNKQRKKRSSTHLESNQIKRDNRTTALPLSLSAVNHDEIKKMFLDAAKTQDGWANVMVGLAGRMDKRINTRYGSFNIISDNELEAIYFGDGLGNRLVDVVADDMTREWITITSANDEDDEQFLEAKKIIETELERLDAISHFNEALKWARLYGGSIIVIGALDGQDLSEPLNINRIKGIDYLRVVDRSDIYLASSTFQKDPQKPKFGEPIVLNILFHVGTQTIYQNVHISRCLIFKGRRVPAGASTALSSWERFWGLSEIQMNYEALRDWGGMIESVANIMYEFVIGKYKLANLASMLAAGNESAVINRMEIINMAKSIIHAVLLGEGEEYTRDSISLAGIGDVIDRFMGRISSTSGIPITKLFGRSPAGMNATGESDQNDYYDQVKSKQETKLKPAIRKLVEIICVWKKIVTPILIEFNPLFQLNEKEQSEVKLIEANTEEAKARTYNTYILAGVLDPEMVYNIEFSDVDLEEDKMINESESEEMKTPSQAKLEITGFRENK